MTNQIKKTIKHQKLETIFRRKGEKTKFGGAGDGGVYRDITTGKDYLLKRIEMNGASPVNKVMANWRVWDEILASKLLRVAGVAVPSMFAVEDKDGVIYVASRMLPNVKNCTAQLFKSLPDSIKGPVLASHLVHCWIGNRDLINSSGENFVIDGDSRIFNVDIGASLFSGFRSLVSGQDDRNFNPDNISNLLLAEDNANFGKLLNNQNQLVNARNKDHIKEFFSDLFTSPDAERSYAVQGALTLSRFSDKDIEEIVNNSGHTPENKRLRIDVLIARKNTLLNYITEKYGPNALKEEQISLDLQRIFHKHGILNPYKGKGGSDAVVSYASQYANAIKPKVRINQDNSISISPINAAIVNKLKQLSNNNISSSASAIVIRPPVAKFTSTIHAEITANILQVFFFSHGYTITNDEKTPFHQSAYKGDGHWGFRPTVDSTVSGINISLPPKSDVQKITSQIALEFGISPDSIIITQNSFTIKNTGLADLAHLLMDNSGARKTAVISENEEGKILAGRLDPIKKGVTGFATAGGGSDRPYNPEQAAKEEGADEFGHSIDEQVALIPLGTTLPNTKTKNIFLVPPTHTSTVQDLKIGYKEFQDGTIRYYSFEEFRRAFTQSGAKFDRTSVNLYLNYYQKEIQKAITRLNVDNVIVQISKAPATLGAIYLKPAIDRYDFTKNEVLNIENNDVLINLLDKLMPENYHLSNKLSKQGTNKTINRQVVAIDNAINPALFYKLLTENMTLQNNNDLSQQNSDKTSSKESTKPNQQPIVDSTSELADNSTDDKVYAINQDEFVQNPLEKQHNDINHEVKSPPLFGLDAKLNNLLNALAKMDAYGKKLQTEGATDKGKAAIQLAQELNLEIHLFILKSAGAKPDLLAIDLFKKEFSQKLHSKDELMHAHRAIWKPIVANILIALTGIGFLALLINMAYQATLINKDNSQPFVNKFLFFAKPKSQEITETVDKELNSACKS